MLLECKYVLLSLVCPWLVGCRLEEAKSVPPLVHTFQRYPLTNRETIVLFTQYSCLAKIVDGPQLSLRQGETSRSAGRHGQAIGTAGSPLMTDVL